MGKGKGKAKKERKGKATAGRARRSLFRLSRIESSLVDFPVAHLIVLRASLTAALFEVTLRSICRKAVYETATHNAGSWQQCWNR